MAKLPSGIDIQRGRTPTGTPGVRVPGLEFSPVAEGGRALARGGADVAQALTVFAKAGDEADDFETRKKLIDFNLETEQALDEHRRAMPPGGTGFAQTFEKDYEQRAKALFKTIPPAQRDRVDLALVERNAQLQNRALDYEAVERNRYDVEGLETTLGKTRDAVVADPAKRNQMLAEGAQLIELAPISPAEKARLGQKYGIEVDRAAVTSRIMSAKTAKDFEALRNELAPETADQRRAADVTAVLTSGKARARPGGWAASNPTWQALGPFEKAAAMALMEADGMKIEDARNVLAAMINRATKAGEDLGGHVSQKIYQPTIEPAQEARLLRILASPKFKELTRWGAARAEGREGDPVNGATHFLAPEATMLALERQNPGKYKNWGPRGANWTGYDEATGEYRGVILRDSSHAFLAPDGAAEGGGGEPDPTAYQGPYGNLSLTERKQLWAQAEAKRAAAVKDISAEITKLEGMSVQGYTLPEPMLADLETRVMETGDKTLEAQFVGTLGTAQISAELSRGRPEDVAAVLTEARSRMAQSTTPGQMERVKALEKLQAEMSAAVRDDAITWANRVKIPVDGKPLTVEALNPNDPELFTQQLERRFEQARGVAEYYGQPVQVFTKAERAAYSATLKSGGPQMLSFLSSVVKAGGANSLDALREISQDAPEAASVGWLVSVGGSQEAVKDAAEGMRLRASKDFKSLAPDQTLARETMLAATNGALGGMPQSEQALIDVANAIYETRAQKKGLASGKITGPKGFDQELWLKGLNEALGQTTGEDKTVYGGIATQDYDNGGWFSSGQMPALLPPNLRTDGLRDALEALVTEDFADNRPRAGDGSTVEVSRIRNATLQTVAAGRYLVALGDPLGGDPQWLVDSNGQKYVLDLNAFEPVLRERRPDLFRP